MRKFLYLIGILLIFSVVLVFVVRFPTEYYSPSDLYYTEDKHDSQNFVLLNVPFVKQEPWYCSEAAASMVLQYYGHDVSQYQVHENGYESFENMLQFISRYVNCEYRQGVGISELKDQIDDGDPIIIRILLENFRHTLVVVGYDDNHIFVHDPGLGKNIKASPEALMYFWEPTDYLAIVFKE